MCSTTPVKQRVVLPFVFLLASCGGGSDTSTPNPQSAPVPVTITKAGNGCLLSHNADAVVSYSMGAQQARTLLWNCANINNLTRVGAEAFFTFNTTLSCYVEEGVGWKTGNCSQPAAAPMTPTVTANVNVSGAPLLQFIGAGTYQLIVDFDATNTGNVSLFGAKVQLMSSPLHFASLTDIPGNGSISGLAFMSVGVMQHVNGLPILSTSTTSGQAYTVTLTALDRFSNPLGSTSFQITAP